MTAAPTTRSVDSKPKLTSHLDVQLTDHLAERLSVAAAGASISRAALVRAILSATLPPVGDST